jgi:hypothetical protein
MRTIAAATSLLLGLNLPLHAAVFSCQFLGGPTPLTCTVDSTKIAPCKQTISASLIALCEGGTNVPGTVNHLSCYYAVPEAEAALQKQAQSSPEAFANATDAVPGIRARAMEWLPNATAPGNNLGLLYSDGSTNYITLCNVAKATTAAKKRK